jgi:hypothetical protein
LNEGLYWSNLERVQRGREGRTKKDGKLYEGFKKSERI